MFLIIGLTIYNIKFYQYFIFVFYFCKYLILQILAMLFFEALGGRYHNLYCQIKYNLIIYSKIIKLFDL